MAAATASEGRAEWAAVERCPHLDPPKKRLWLRNGRSALPIDRETPLLSNTFCEPWGFLARQILSWMYTPKCPFSQNVCHGVFAKVLGLKVVVPSLEGGLVL